MKIYLFRHGQSTFNRDKKFTGFIDARLTARGIEDARTIGRKLTRRRFDIAFESDLTRSKQTLREVLSFQTRDSEIEIIEDERIKERDYGELAGQHHAHYITGCGEDLYAELVRRKRIPEVSDPRERAALVEKLGRAKFDVYHRSYRIPPPGGESVAMVEERVLAFITDLLYLMRERRVNVAISAHGNSMRPFRRFFEGLSVDEMMALENPWDDYFSYDVTDAWPRMPKQR
jgi:2,3-bisphosphoglycerate-dependent phosphoglycerate mutase